MGSYEGVLLLAGGLVFVVAGAEVFFEGLLALATRVGISAFVLAVVLSGFELENLAAGIAANLRGLGSAAAGTFLGGTTFLALAVPGLGALIAPIRASIPAPVLVWTALAPVPLLALGIDGDLSRLDGGLLVAWALLALAGIAAAGRGIRAAEGGETRKRFALARVLVGLGVLTGAGAVLGDGLRRVVQSFGISQSLLGNTAIAAAVEVEEVGRVVAPARHDRGEVALANIFGTVAHFAALNAGIIALVRPIHLDHTSRTLHLPAAVASVLVLVAVTRARRGVDRPAAALLLTLYVGYVAAAVAVSV